MCASGRGVPHSDEQGLAWLQKAAAQGFALAQTNLAAMLMEGRGAVSGGGRDPVAAAAWWEKAALQGRDQEAMIALALLYETGDDGGDGGGQGNSSSSSSSNNNNNSNNQQKQQQQQQKQQQKQKQKQVQQSDEESLRWLTMAAEAGSPDAQCKLAIMYDNGDGAADQSDMLALEWYEKAAEQNHASAQYNLGVMYCSGQGVDKSLFKAYEWWKRAAQLGQAHAKRAMEDLLTHTPAAADGDPLAGHGEGHEFHDGGGGNERHRTQRGISLRNLDISDTSHGDDGHFAQMLAAM